MSERTDQISHGSTRRQLLNRCLIYAAGTIFLAAGITLHTKTNLGVSPLVSVPYSISQIWDISFPLLNFFMYMIYLALQFILNGKTRQLSDLLQIPFAVVFNLLLQLLSDGYDKFIYVSDIHMESLVPRCVMLVVAVAMTGVGVAMMVPMKIIPNPGDGLAKSVAYALKRSLGFGKNFIDFSSVAITCAIGLIAAHRLVGVGVGTIVGMIFVGRCVAAFNHFFLKKMLTASGQSDINTSSKKS